MNINFRDTLKLSEKPPSSVLQSSQISKIPQSLLDLPIELKTKIFRLVPNELKLTCKQFYILENELYFEKFINEFGIKAIYILSIYVLPYIIKFIKSFEYWRSINRKIISNYFNLPTFEPNPYIRNLLPPLKILNCQYIKDSWKFVYSLFKNRRLFAEYTDYEIDEPSTSGRSRSNSMIHINKTYLVKYKKTVSVSPDLYNLSCGLIIHNAIGLGTMKFQVLNTKTGEVLLNFYPPTNINEITPHNKFILLDLGNFIVPSKSKTTYDAKDKIDNDEDEYDKTVEITIIMEESGLYIKSGFSICYIDINAFPKEKLLEVANTTDLVSISHDKEVMKKFENKWIYWYIENQEPRTENVINYLLKDFYKVLNESYKLFANDDDNEDSDDDNANGTNQDNEDNTNSPITRRRKSAFSISLSYPTFQRLNSYNNLLDSNSYNTNSTLGDLQEYYKTKHNYKMNNSSSAISQMRPLGPLTPAMSMSPITNSHDSAPNFNTDLFSPKENRTRNRASSFTNGLFENLKVKLPKEGEDEIIDNLIKIRRNTISQIRGFPYSDVFNSIGTNSDNDNNNNNDNDNDNEMDIDVEREARICKDKNDRRQELEDRFIKVSKKINIQDYNFKFFNKLNEQNELIERKFKFKNIIYQREFEEINNKLKKHKLNSNKMNQIFQKKLKLSNDKLKTNKYSDDNNSDENNSDNNDNNKDVLDYDLELNEPLKWKVLTIFKL
ncbi:unnamed protein product [[Candida] boidinii]|uniref:Unnamed protein product n=1 Tax=Candida boidinii TaxID=5477 RepID=A0A9W6SUS0_CANBO|nr:hypothetical protein B5S30_g1741 [[Candida] boidinii]GME67401.1 unnamed protein product [[Candida] boidinii]